MKLKFTLFIIVALLINSILTAKTYTVTSVGYTFSPDNLSINVGDTVVFSLGSIHDAIEVNKSVWDADGSTSNGGFSTPYGGGKVVFNNAGTFYYVCQPHVSLGMKGTIVVGGGTTAINENKINTALNVYPNPATDYINVEMKITNGNNIHLNVFDITGKLIRNIDLSGVNPGYSVQAISLENMVAGKYFVRYSDGSVNVTQPFLIIKH